jgi:hypothetical protein
MGWDGMGWDDVTGKALELAMARRRGWTEEVRLGIVDSRG